MPTPVAAQTQPTPHLTPPAATPQARSGKGSWIGAVVALAALGGGFGLRAHLRSEKVKTCESGKGDDLLAACRVACDVDPQKFCVIHGDLARTALDAASLADATKSYDKACSAQACLGCRKLGSLQEIDKDEAAALGNYQKACDGKSASGCAWLGKRLERGRGIARDRQKAISLYENACSGDDPASCALLAWSSPRRPDTAELFQKAAPALKKECASGGLWECAAFGALQQNGQGVERDLAAANTAFRKACSGGLAEGCNDAAALELVESNAAAIKPVASLRDLCDQGSLAACNNLALLQANVPFTLRQEQGTSLFAVTCSAAVTRGCTQNGAVVRPPESVTKDLTGAAAMLEKACAEGLGVACANLGAFHESGLRGAKDAAKALSLYEKACAAGAPDGCAPMKEAPFRAGESWTGNYVCGQGQTDLTLRILDATDTRVEAIFEFDYAPRQTTGRFLLSGAYDASRGAITFTPGIWLEQPAGWTTVGMNGQVSLQKTIFTGTIDNPSCAGFRLVRMVSDMVEPRCDPSARFVEGHGCVPIPKPGPTMLGAWSGRGKESTGSTWPMSATLGSLESGRCGRVSYPTLTCGGDWYCTKSTDGKTLRAREIITSGLTRCDSTGFVDLTLSDDGQTASFRWSSPVRPGGSTAELSRAAGP